jgi:tetratricopeptide (TPR) repeat protein
MNKKRPVFSILLMLVLLAPLSVPAQQTPDSIRVRQLERLPETMPNNKPEVIDRIERLMRMRDFDRAATLLELELEKTPHQGIIKSLLSTCYEEAKEYEKLLLFLKQQLETEPPRFPLYRDLGRAYILLGHTDSARVILFRSAEFVTNREGSLATIANIYHKYGLYEYESEFIDSARTLTGNQNLLPDKMGDALAAQKRYGEATLEYLTFMEKDSVAAKQGEEKLISMIRFPESADTVMTLLSNRLRHQSESSRLLNIYGQLLIEQGKFEEAFEFFKGLDSTRDLAGADIMYFMRECNRRHQYEITISAGEYMNEHFPQTTLRNSILFLTGTALTATGHYFEALETYQNIADDRIRPAHSAEAFLKIGQIYNDNLNDINMARENFHKVIRIVPGSRFDIEAKFGMADIFIKEKNFDSAISQFESITQWEVPEEIAEKAEFILAEVYLFKGDYQESVTRYRRLINTFPRGLYINDAIQYSLIISETLEDSPGQMDLFATSEFFRYTQKADSLEYYLTKICKVGIPSLAPISYLYLSRLLRLQERYDEAVAMADSLESQYPESYYLPYGLKVKADIFLVSPGQKELAMDLYRKLLNDYSTYPFAAEIRDIIRREITSGQI